MKYHLLLVLAVIVFLSGCVTTKKETVSSVGISSALTSDTKEASASMPVTFILTIKNLASETANDISAQLLNLTGWGVENRLQYLDVLLPSDLYKFTWIAYASSETNKTFTPHADIFYKMKTNANLKLRVYDNAYLNSLKPEERKTIRENSALLYSTTSKNTPIAIITSLQQPFILTSYSQVFPFIIEIKNVGWGSPYIDYSAYPPLENEKDFIAFQYVSNSTLICDYRDGAFVKLVSGGNSIVCRLIATQDDVNQYSDFGANFTINYAYLGNASVEIKVT